MPPRMSRPGSRDRERHQLLIADQDRLIGETVAADQQKFIKNELIHWAIAPAGFE